ncbi:MAG TPA: hypothetical protein PKA37_00630, partial [Planctomycetota bacterium]|nr:hypothetical protein [Planctomycetota bacterium]
MSFEGTEPVDGMELAERFRDSKALVAALRSCGIAVDQACAEGVRLEPGHGATILFRLPASHARQEDADTFGYLSIRSQDRVREAFEKSLAKNPVPSSRGPGVALLRDPVALIYLFPNDRRLTDLRWVSDLTKLKRTLEDLPAPRFARHVMRSRRSRMRIVRYKPERRFIAEVRACFEDEEKGTHFKERLFLRYFPDSRGEHLLAINRQIRESGGQHLVPVGLAARMEGRLYVECLVPGRQALQCLEEGLAIDGRRLARALYEFHQCSVPMLEARTVADEVARSLEQLRVLGCADRDVADAVEAV